MKAGETQQENIIYRLGWRPGKKPPNAQSGFQEVRPGDYLLDGNNVDMYHGIISTKGDTLVSDHAAPCIYVCLINPSIGAAITGLTHKHPANSIDEFVAEWKRLSSPQETVVFIVKGDGDGD